MSKLFASLGLLSVAVLLTVGCGEAPTDNTTTSTPNISAPAVMSAAYESATLCGSCGQVKGGEACCAEGAAACEGCKLAKGSPGCCKIEAGSDVVLCAGCGEAKGTEACCAEGAEKCAKCNLHKGAPGCCVLEKVAADQDAAPESEGEES